MRMMGQAKDGVVQVKPSAAYGRQAEGETVASTPHVAQIDACELIKILQLKRHAACSTWTP